MNTENSKLDALADTELDVVSGGYFPVGHIMAALCKITLENGILNPPSEGPDSCTTY
jgi:hypothetical protein